MKKSIILPAVMIEHETRDRGFEQFLKFHSSPNISRVTNSCSLCRPTLEQHLSTDLPHFLPEIKRSAKLRSLKFFLQMQRLGAATRY